MSALLDLRPLECVFTDACNEGARGSFGCVRFYFNWSVDCPGANEFHICFNEKEVIAVTLAAYRLGPLWQNKSHHSSDNTITVSCLRKSSPPSSIIIKC